MTPPIDSTAIYDKSLYETEESDNKFETELIQAITGLSNIRWWHRNIARTGFAINGFVNRYPDFIVRTHFSKMQETMRFDLLKNKKVRKAIDKKS